ncbi:MAG: Crp/Fnr family transcriptional regulator [Planctomycetes bacterium]|nr:Crp/Fnr family transcriptional regulator [Planctomycetota bacterium]
MVGPMIMEEESTTSASKMHSFGAENYVLPLGNSQLMIASDTIRRVPMFAGLRDDHISMIVGICERRLFRKNEVLFRQGDEGNLCYVIIEGLVKIQKRSGDGRTKTLAILENGDCFGEMAIISAEKRTATAVCLTESHTFVITKESFSSILEEHHSIALYILTMLAERLRKADEQIEALTFMNIPSRIITEIQKLADQFGKPLSRYDGDQGVNVEFPITHQELADMVGTNRETVSKFLSTFKKEGSIDIVNKRILITDPKMLETWL